MVVMNVWVQSYLKALFKALVPIFVVNFIGVRRPKNRQFSYLPNICKRVYVP